METCGHHGGTRGSSASSRVAVNGEKPASVAEAFGLTRNAVDQIKNRLVAKLLSIAANLRGED